MFDGNYTFDLQRIFIGNLPLLFFAEIVLRTTIMYVWTLIMVRITGKRSMNELTAMELLLVIGLGSAVGDPMFYPNVPVLHGMAAISLVIGLHEATVALTNRSKTLHNFVVGTPGRIVVDGCIDLEGIKETGMSREELFMSLRQSSYAHLGQLQRVYIEPDGKFSMYPYKDGEIRPGLAIMPPSEFDSSAIYEAGGLVPKSGVYVCNTCGYPETYEQEAVFVQCPRCEGKYWEMAAYEGTDRMEEASSG